MAPAETSKQRAVTTAARLFQRQGFAATGLNQIIAESGTPKGSFYFHFPGGKDELAVLAVEHAGREMDDIISAVLERHHDPADAVRALARTWGNWLARSGYVEGCPITTVALEQAPASATLLRSCAHTFERWHRLLAQHLTAAQIPAERSNRLATLTLSSFEGAFVVSRTQQTTDAFNHTAELICELIAATNDGS